MSIEISPSQERRLHFILDRGLATLQGLEKSSTSTPNASHLYSYPTRKPATSVECVKNTEKTKLINTELKSIQSKLATLEAKLSNNFEIKPKKSRPKSPVVFLKKKTADSSTNIQTGVSRRKASRERFKHIENSTKELGRFEKNVILSRTRHRSSAREKEKTCKTSKKELSRADMNEKKQEKEVKEMKEINLKLMNDYEKLLVAYKRSERIRKKQCELILKLKSELNCFN